MRTHYAKSRRQLEKMLGVVLIALATTASAYSQSNSIPSTTAMLVTPQDRELIPAGTDVQVLAVATTDALDSIASVTFLSDTNVLQVVTNWPYSFFWSNVPAGYFTLQAIAQNTAGSRATSFVAHVTVAESLVQNGGFETGDFTGWTLPPPESGFYNNVVSRENPTTPVILSYFGSYGAYLGDIQVASLSQTLSTVPGQYYLLYLWLVNPMSGAGQLFNVNWNTNDAATNTLWSIIAPPDFWWTKLQFLALASGTSTTLQIQAENDTHYFGLDSIFVTPIPPPRLQSTSTSTNGLKLFWLTAPGVTYQIQYKTNMLDPNWSDLIPAFVASGTNYTFLDTNSVSSPERYYRLLIQ